MMARNNVRLMPLSAEGKDQVLHKLQGSPHFEKTLTASSALHYQGKSWKLTLPSWFVQKHGDKFRESAILQTESSTKAWPVTLKISFISTNCTHVIFSGGWKAFATSNGLLEGDSLVFALTAMSEFKVYLFRSTKLVKTVVDASGHRSPPSFRNSSCRKDPTAPRPALNQYSSGNASQADFALQKDTSLNNSAQIPGFLKKLTTSNICRSDGSTCLEIPLGFWKIYGSRIGSLVKVQGIHEESPVQTMACYTNASTSHGQGVRHYLRADWRAFVKENKLQVGQALLFTLAADSFFIVREQQSPS